MNEFNLTPKEVVKLQEEREMFLHILSLVPAAGLADALNEAGYDKDVIVPILRSANADLSLYLMHGEDF